MISSAEVLANLPLALQAFSIVSIAFFPWKTRQLLVEKQICVLVGQNVAYIVHCTCFPIFLNRYWISARFSHVDTRWLQWCSKFVFFLIFGAFFFSFSSFPCLIFLLQAQLWVNLFIMLGMILILSVPRSLEWDSFSLTFAHKNEMSAF